MRRNTSPGFSSTVRHGVGLVYLALIMLILIAVLGLAIDTGYVFLTAHQLQNAADAAALAGAYQVVTDTTAAVTHAQSEAAKNSAAHVNITLDAGDVTVGFYNRGAKTFTPGVAPYNAVKVVARRTKGSTNGPLQLLFAPIFGITTSDVSRQAIAVNTAVEAGLILLDSSASPALQLTGTGSNPNKVVVANGAVVIDSASSTAVQGNGNPTVSASELDIVGNDVAASNWVTSTTLLNVNSPVTPDPLASLAVPAKPAPGSFVGGVYQPGYFNGIDTGGTMLPGIYFIDGGISLKGNDTLRGTGVMLYLNTGGITLKGTTSIDISAPTNLTGASAVYNGISYFEARSNSSAIELRGTTGQNDTGTMYFPNGDVTIHGTPNTTASQLIANTLTVAGDGQLKINYDARHVNNNYKAYLAQ